VGSISSMSQLRRPVSAIFLIIFTSTVFAAPTSGWRTRVSPDLLAAYDAANTILAPSIKATPPSMSVTERSTARFDSKGRVQVDVRIDCAQGSPASTLIAVGLEIHTTVKVPPLCVLQGWTTVTALPDLASAPGVKLIAVPVYSASKKPTSATNPLLGTQPQASGGQSIDQGGISLMRADQFIQQTGINGAGVKIGVISDDAVSLQTIQSRGELPGVQIVPPNPPTHSTLTDEGTMMLEEVYAVAPGAMLLFCGSDNNTEYIACVQDLVAAGAWIITDDIATPGEDLMSASGDIASAVQSTLTTNPSVSLFTAAGNYNHSYWEGKYSASSLVSAGYAPLTCPSSGQVDYYVQSFNGAPDELLNVNQAGTYSVKFQWADPYDANVSNFDVYLLDVTAGTTQCLTTTSSSTTNYDLSIPFSVAQYKLEIATPDQSAVGKAMKLLIAGDGAPLLPVYTTGSVVSPQAFVPGVMSIGAVMGSDGVGTNIESYSALGPINLIFPSPAQLQAPMLVAPDDIYVDLNGTYFSTATWPDGFFHGTSAASPNAAAVAALLRSAFPSLTPAQVNSYLQAGATQLGGSAPNSTFGYGRVDALGALGQIPGPTISGLAATTIVGGTSSPPVPFVVGGTGALKVTALSSVFWMTTVISPSNCGNGAKNCTLTLTPAIGSFAPSTVQVSVTDGANRVQSMQIPVTVTKPAPPAVSITSGTMQSVPVNTAIAPINFSVAGTGPLTVYASNNGVPGVNVTSGCGTTTMTCTANLGTAGSATGSVTLVIGAQDSYGQVSSSLTTVTITNPPPPTIMITSGATQSVMVNAAIAPVAFTLSGTGNLTVTPATTGISSLTISSGCGTTTMSCTASLGMAQSTAGTASLTLTVEDSYVQSATASATITENAPPSGKSGGGALDPWALLGLTGLVLVQLSRPKRKRGY
jgi:hypothetical protein